MNLSAFYTHNSPGFEPIFHTALEKSKWEPANVKSYKARMYQMVQALLFTDNLAGATAEAGCLYGTSSYIILSYSRDTHYIYDSMQGLSKPNNLDYNELSKEKMDRLSKKTKRNNFLTRVEDTLSDFKHFMIGVGWIPDCFNKQRHDFFRFVHIDVDLYEPTYESIKHFYPRLIKGGVIVCDDYGFKSWLGAKAGIEAYCKPRGIPVISTVAGNAIIIKMED